LNETIQTNNIQKLDHLDQGQNNTDINNVENAQTTVNLTSILHLNETNIANNHEQLQLNKNEDKQNNTQGEVNVNKEV